MKEKTKDRKKFILRAVLWFLAVCLLTSLLYFIPGISGALNSTYIAEYDSVFVSDEVECYLVKNEKITYSNKSGTVSYAINEGTHVRKYTVVAKIGSDVYTSEQPGLISYSADGYESYFTEDNIPNIKKEEAESISFSNQELGKNQVVSGDPLFKAVDDKEWFVVFWIDKEDVNQYVKGNKVSVIIDDALEIKATINDIYDQENRYMVVLRTQEYFDKLAYTRKVKAEVVTVDQAGLFIQQKSIVTVDGQPGVYVKQINGDFEFVRVKVLSLIDENAIVADGTFTETVDEVTTQVKTINVYDEILKNAKSSDKGGEKVE
ncbi:MAG: HlyD family efflux transporter periplasmic adaptor subunit [Firmicutes bacterium]|nr:HlyD family efflux transporter periplasmic adaptor subunit [Bacillota bacterium]